MLCCSVHCLARILLRKRKKAFNLLIGCLRKYPSKCLRMFSLKVSYAHFFLVVVLSSCYRHDDDYDDHNDYHNDDDDDIYDDNDNNDGAETDGYDARIMMTMPKAVCESFLR